MHTKRSCALSQGGADSDVMLDMILRCGGRGKTDFVFFNTGLEYRATLEHLDELEGKYGIEIIRCKPTKTIPSCVKEYGVPFWSKFASDMIHRLQSHGFTWEDKPYEQLIAEYPKCKTALEWWCDIGNTSQYSIRRAPYLKEFMISNPPTFRISDKCCTYAKKKTSSTFAKGKGYDLFCTGVRRAEGGIRSAAYKTCFDEKNDADYFRPVFWLRDEDKERYREHYGISYSKCYTEYFLSRTGCFGCPFGKRFDDELCAIENFEPKLYKAAIHIFGESYEYTRQYRKFKDEMKRKERTDKTEHGN